MDKTKNEVALYELNSNCLQVLLFSKKGKGQNSVADIYYHLCKKWGQERRIYLYVDLLVFARITSGKKEEMDSA